MAVAIAASGSIFQVGPANLSGTLRVVGSTEFGAIDVSGHGSRLNLFVFGKVSGPSSELQVKIVRGTGPVPGTTYDFVREMGSGTIHLVLGPSDSRGSHALMVSLDSSR